MSSAAAKKETKLGIDAKKSEDMASWYTQVRIKLVVVTFFVHGVLKSGSAFKVIITG